MLNTPLSTTMLRFAGLFYLAIILCGVSAEAVLRGPLIDAGDAAQTASAIATHAGRFQASIIADLLMALADAALAVLLYLLLRPVSQGLALAALVFRLLQSGLIAVNLLNLQMAALIISSGGSAQMADLALGFLTLHSYGYDLGLVFFGINCLLTAQLIVKSGVIPRLIGIGIALSGLVYLAGSAARFAAPDLLPFVLPAYALPLLAETTFCLWLLVLPGVSRHRAVMR